MSADIQFDLLNDALRRAGSHWNAAQAHGLLSSRLAVEGAGVANVWLAQVLENTDENNAFSKECRSQLMELFQATHKVLFERQSAFEPLLPDDGEDTAVRTEALANWSEGYLHGLVSSRHDDALRERIAAEPVADIVRDMLQITRAGVDDAVGAEDNEAAYQEIVEYLRVAAQLIYEELAGLRPATTA